MTNTVVVCLLFVTFLCSTNLSLARQVPKECATGPSYWCLNLKSASDCGSVGHCTATVWSKHNVDIHGNEISDKFINLFRELKDNKDLINESYLAQRIKSTCSSIRYSAIATMCRKNTAHQEKYISHVLSSDVAPETICRIVGMCNNMKLDNILSLSKKKPVEKPKHKETLLGASRCTWGPSYWCSNFTTGRECKATKHCVSRVWSQMKVADDKDSICKICTDMVTQARDQLESNQTQEDLKQVFEGSCKLIPIKLARKECMKMADEFVPELVETLASQMNPQIVCSVAGLCNNAEIDTLLDKYNEQLKLRQDCHNCGQVVSIARRKFDDTSYEDFLVGLLQVCREAGSFSDSCSMLVFKYYENILAAVKKDLVPHNVCHLTGQCVHLFHYHDEFDFRVENLTSVNDDVPCEFCEQVIQHLRDVLVANTTEEQFFRVLKGICSQTGAFKDECLSLVDQYYPVIYQYLLSDLKPKEICSLGGLCPNYEKDLDLTVAPLIPRELIIKAKGQLNSKHDSDKRLEYATVPNKQSNVRVLGTEVPPPLPIERMFVRLPEGKNSCSFCEYFLHYLQLELSDTKTEEKIRDTVEKACDRLPTSVSGQCKQFVSSYGPAVIALLVQEIDPASVCPALGLCPQTHEVRKVDINAGKSNCPLCLFAVMQLEAVLKSNKTEANIRAALDGLCNHLSVKLRSECVDFVETYSDQLVEALLSNLNAQQICVALNLCKGEENIDPLRVSHSSIDKFHDNPILMSDRNNRKQPMLPKHMLETGGDIETNEIPDNTVNGRVVVSDKPNSVCILCEFVMKEIDDQIKDKANEDEIKKIVHNVCTVMPKSVRPECDAFVEKYADLIISMLAQELDPEDVCRELKLCPSHINTPPKEIKQDVLNCAVCETVVAAVKKVLTNDKMDRNIVHIVEKSCALLPAKYYERCNTMMEIYGDSVIHLIEEYGTKNVCQKIGLCDTKSTAYVKLFKEDH